MDGASGRRRGHPPADPDDVAAAEAAAARILAGAAQTELSLRRRLEMRGFSASAAREAAIAMARRGYVDDDAFAESVVGRRLRRGYGRAYVAAELRARGVGERPLDDALRGVGVGEERTAAASVAAALLDRRPPREGEPEDRRLARVAAALQRRGFTVDAVRYALRVAAGRAPADDGSV